MGGGGEGGGDKREMLDRILSISEIDTDGMKYKRKKIVMINVGKRGAGLFNFSFVIGMVVGRGGAIQTL